MNLLSPVRKLFDTVWWSFMTGKTVLVKWPRGWVVLNELDDGTTVSVSSSDPNDHYRPWLEEHVGAQGIDWQWREIMRPSMTTPGYEDQFQDLVAITLRKGKESFASIIGLKWN